MRHAPEMRSAEPIETRNDDEELSAATQAVEELRSAVEERLSGLDGLTARLDALETRAQRPGATAPTNAEPIERRAFTGYLRHGRESMDPEEVRSLRVSDDTR